MVLVGYIAVLLGGYLLGCSSMALYLSAFRGVDMRNNGSGNLGASNALVLMGWGAGIAVALHDIGKAAAAVLLVVVALVTLITDYIVVGTVTTMIVVPVYVGVATQSVLLAAILCIASAVILYKHRENYVRIANGTEIGLRRANRGDDRAKK